MKIIINLSKLSKLTPKADKVLVDPEAEEVLIELLRIKKQVEEAEEQIKLTLREEAEKINPQFEGLKGNQIVLRYSGGTRTRFLLDESRIKDIPDNLYTKKVSYSVNSNLVEEFRSEKGELPIGINESIKEAEKKISFYAKKGTQL